MSASRHDKPDDLVELGRITSAYGVRGMVKVQPHSAQAEVLLAARQWWLGRQSPLATSRDAPDTVPADLRLDGVKTSRPQGATVVAALEGLIDRDEAEALRGTSVFVPRSAFPAPDDDEYYWVDLVGCMVYGVDDADAPVLLGRVDAVTENGAHALLDIACLQEVQGEAEPSPVLSSKGRQRSLLVPFVNAHVLNVDLGARRIDTNWPADLD
jgi:16S rRNA processing protein RimM